MGTPSEGVCENVLESKADNLFSPTRERTLVLVNPFSKVQTLLVVVTEISLIMGALLKVTRLVFI